MTYLIDTHSHLNHEDFEPDLPETIDRSKAAGIDRIVVASYDMKSSEKALEIACMHEGLVATAGIHPHDAKSMDEANLERIREMAGHPRVVAIGEIGLDFHYDFSPRENQEEAFRLQLRLAREVGLPVVVHSREAPEKTLEVLTTEPPARGVMHCFSGDADFARKVLDLGYYIGIDGPITYKRSDELREIVKWVPLDRLLVETDCPYLAPQQYRGKRNEPAYVRFVAEKVAEVKGLALDAVAEATTRNALELLGEW